jgi:hypothetical protein
MRVAAIVEARVLPKAGGRTVGQHRRAIEREILAADPQAALPDPRRRGPRIAADGTWRRPVTDPATGRLIDYGTTRYTPPRTSGM